jgi:hypothetical protein
MSVEYLHLIPNGPLPDINCWRPFRAVAIIEDKRIHYETLGGQKKSGICLLPPLFRKYNVFMNEQRDCCFSG